MACGARRWAFLLVVLLAIAAVFDLIRERTLRAEDGEPLVIPPRAVLVPGSRPASGEVARRHGIQLQTPVIVKYREESTDASVTLEEALR